MAHHYIRNLRPARVNLVGGALRLMPKGSKGSVKPVPRKLLSRPDIKRAVQNGHVQVMSATEYKAYLLNISGVPAKKAAAPAAVEPVPSEPEAPEEEPEAEEAPEEEPEAEEEPEEEPEAVEESEEGDAEVIESPLSGADSDEASDDELMPFGDFEEMKKDEKIDYLKAQGLDSLIDLSTHKTIDAGYQLLLG